MCSIVSNNRKIKLIVFFSYCICSQAYGIKSRKLLNLVSAERHKVSFTVTEFNCQEIRWEERLRNDVFYVEWDIKP